MLTVGGFIRESDSSRRGVRTQKAQVLCLDCGNSEGFGSLVDSHRMLVDVQGLLIDLACAWCEALYLVGNGVNEGHSFNASEVQALSSASYPSTL